MRKKKILFHSDLAIAKTGFGRVMKALILHLYKTKKYEIVHYCCGVNKSNPALQKTPWKSIGCLPDSQQEIDQINRDPGIARDASYGGYMIDRVMQEEKPDIYIGAQDIWAFPGYHEKWWWNKIPCVIWTTLDSLPLLPMAVEVAPKIKNYWMWSNFAEKEMHRLGHKHVKTVHGAVEDSKFYKLPDQKRKDLRQKFGLKEDTFIAGFVFRNQLRKQVASLLEGFSLFRKEHPNYRNSKLLLHTSYSEGWQINKLAARYGVDTSDILTTYICKVCNEYEIKNFHGEEQKCKYCGAEKACSTTNVGKGVTEDQLNEIYNLMDVYVHPISSGGMEVTCIENKLAELITCVTNYSCGEELCEEGANSLPLDWTEFLEHGTEFIKSSTLPSSISKQLIKVYNMPIKKRAEMGKKAREWAINNYSSKKVGKIFEDFIDSQEITDFNFIKETPLKNPDAIIPEIEDDSLWIKTLYKEILKMEVTEQDSGYQTWAQQLK